MRVTRATRVLLADDHPTLRLGLRVLLEHAPDIAVVGEAENGAETLALLETLQREQLSFKFNITTNGTLLTEAALQYLNEHQFGILLSLDGPRGTHDTHRTYPNGRGSFAAAMQAAERIKRSGRSLWVQATVTRSSPGLDVLLSYLIERVGADLCSQSEYLANALLLR